MLDEYNYVPLSWSTRGAKVLRRLLQPLAAHELMLEARRLHQQFHPDLLFVFKGQWVRPEIVLYCRSHNTKAVNFYPDVSFLVHGKYIPKTLPHYDHIFTTKSFGRDDMRRALGVQNISLLLHGYDPEIHRPIELGPEDQTNFRCDVAFIGTWSPKKERLMAELVAALPGLNLRIYGNQWDKRVTNQLDQAVVGYGVTGDDYVKAICGAKICLGLLSEARKGASSGDLVTSRTFQIPACRSLMLHERTIEVTECFREDLEAIFFSTPAEMVQKIRFYLERDPLVKQIAWAGFNRAVSDHSIDRRMQQVLNWHESAD